MNQLRSPLRRALGTGSAHSGVAHWRAQRVTAMALVPLSAWFLVSLLAQPDLGYRTLHAWLASVPSGVLAMLLVAVLGYHADLGLGVILEDYVHGAGKRGALRLVLRAILLLAALLALLSILRIALMAPLP